MKEKIRKLTEDKFLKNNLIFFIGSLVVSILNYLYFPILGRILSVENFGEAQAINTLVLQSMVILSALGYVAIHLFTNIKDQKAASEKVKDLEGSALIITLLVIAFVLIFQNRIISYFKFSSFLSLFVICLIFLLNIPFTIKRSWIQAKQKFYDISIVGAIAAISKLSIAVILIFLGFKILGVLAGLLIATLLSLVYVSLRSNAGINFRSHLVTNYIKKIMEDPELRKDLYFAGMILIVLISVTIFYSADVLFVRRYFSTTISGLYSGVSAIANIIFFATIAFSGVLLPSIKIGETKVNQHNFLKAILITIITGSAIWLSFSIAPTQVITLLIGEKYRQFSGLLPSIGIFILLASISNVILTYLIALKKKAAPIISFLGVVFLFTLILLNNSSVDIIINNFIYANSFVLLASFLYIIFDFRKNSALIS